MFGYGPKSFGVLHNTQNDKIHPGCCGALSRGPGANARGGARSHLRKQISEGLGPGPRARTWIQRPGARGPVATVQANLVIPGSRGPGPRPGVRGPGWGPEPGLGAQAQGSSPGPRARGRPGPELEARGHPHPAAHPELGPPFDGGKLVWTQSEPFYGRSGGPQHVGARPSHKMVWTRYEPFYGRPLPAINWFGPSTNLL